MSAGCELSEDKMRDPFRLLGLSVIWSLIAACGAPLPAAPNAALEPATQTTFGFTEPAVALLTPLPDAEWQGASLMLE